MIRKVKYTCDRCERELTTDEDYGIFVRMGYGYPLKKFDLCRELL
jgi:hypothetical protein